MLTINHKSILYDVIFALTFLTFFKISGVGILTFAMLARVVLIMFGILMGLSFFDVFLLTFETI